jgi:hypothetical protein
MTESHSVNRTDREPYIHELDLEIGTIEETKDISALLRGDDWPTSLGDFESTNTSEAQDRLSPEQGLTNRMLLHDFDTDACTPKVSRMEHRCEHPGCSLPFATRQALL